MAYATTLSFAKFKFLVENPATPNTFVKICGSNQRTLSRTKNFDENEVPDCDDDNKPSVIVRGVRSSDWSASINGVLTAEAYETLKAFYAAGTSWRVKFEEEFPAPVGLKTSTGRAFLQSYERDHNRGQNGTVSLSLVADGELVET